jgi:electron transport complex protein RnfB
MEIIHAVMVMMLLGATLGLVLGVSSKLLMVHIDPREETLEAMLPGLDCGACGHPGCKGMTLALLSGKEFKVSVCKPSKLEQRLSIQKYLAEHPGPDGKTLHVEA